MTIFRGLSLKFVTAITCLRTLRLSYTIEDVVLKLITVDLITVLFRIPKAE
jgi:hypothetical protein